MTGGAVTNLDLAVVDVVLDMQSGYVLNFSDRTLAGFLADLGVDIEALPAESKAKRLRRFLRSADAGTAARVLDALLEKRGERGGDAESKHIAKYKSLIGRLRGTHVSLRSVTAGVDLLTLSYVHELETKCDRRMADADLEGAITVARTMLEAVLTELESRLCGTAGEYQGDLAKQFKAIAKQLGMDAGRADLDNNFRQVIGGLTNVVNGLAPIRNKMSDGHARSAKPVPHHARVVVNAAKTVATFLVESYAFQQAKVTQVAKEKRA